MDAPACPQPAKIIFLRPAPSLTPKVPGALIPAACGGRRLAAMTNQTKPNPMNDTPEQLLNDQLATCLAAMQDCLTHAREGREDDRHGHLRRHDIEYVGKLMKASARLTEALAKLKGETRHNIHVSRDGATTPVRRDAGRRG
jgi:hypothetical protein